MQIENEGFIYIMAKEAKEAGLEMPICCGVERRDRMAEYLVERYNRKHGTGYRYLYYCEVTPELIAIKVAEG